jgi:hypothetical protein
VAPLDIGDPQISSHAPVQVELTVPSGELDGGYQVSISCKKLASSRQTIYLAVASGIPQPSSQWGVVYGTV